MNIIKLILLPCQNVTFASELCVDTLSNVKNRQGISLLTNSDRMAPKKHLFVVCSVIVAFSTLLTVGKNLSLIISLYYITLVLNYL